MDKEWGWEFGLVRSESTASQPSAIKISPHLPRPRLPTIVSVKEMLSIYLLYYTGLLPFFKIKADILQIHICRGNRCLQYIDRHYTLFTNHEFAHRALERTIKPIELSWVGKDI